MNIGARESPCGRGAMMLELWRQVVIGSALLVYVAGLACAGSLLVGRIETGGGLSSPTTFLADPLAPAAGAGTRR
jgi:hypothetical protein